MRLCILRWPTWPLFLAASLFKHTVACINLSEVIHSSTLLGEHLASVVFHWWPIFAALYEIHYARMDCWLEGLDGTCTSQFHVKQTPKLITTLTHLLYCLKGTCRLSCWFIIRQPAAWAYLLTRIKSEHDLKNVGFGQRLNPCTALHWYFKLRGLLLRYGMA